VLGPPESPHPPRRKTKVENNAMYRTFHFMTCLLSGTPAFDLMFLQQKTY
jgi:hypothetical protein